MKDLQCTLQSICKYWNTDVKSHGFTSDVTHQIHITIFLEPLDNSFRVRPCLLSVVVSSDFFRYVAVSNANGGLAA